MKLLVTPYLMGLLPLVSIFIPLIRKPRSILGISQCEMVYKNQAQSDLTLNMVTYFELALVAITSVFDGMSVLPVEGLSLI